MRTIGRLLILSCALLGTNPALAGDPRPPQLNISFLSQPAPIVQYGSTRLVYEMLLTNFSKSAYVLDAIDAKAGAMQTKFSGKPLATMISHLGVPAPAEGPADRTIEAGRTVMIFFLLDMGDTNSSACDRTFAARAR